MSRLLITGGAGFLGSRLARELMERGHDVVCIDRLDGDLTVPGTFKSILNEHMPIDRVVHCAATPGREFCERDPAMAIQQNTLMTLLVAASCGGLRVPLCYVSTSEVYGWTMDMKRYVNEDDPLRPRNTYALTKAWGEEACRNYVPLDGLMMLRPSMPYSGTMPIGFGRAALPTMVAQAIAGDEIIVHRNTSRSWTYVDDVIDGMALAIEHGEGIYNVGSEDEQRTMDELATLVLAVTGSESKVRYEDPPPTVSPHKRLSSARLRVLGWHPKVSLMDGITITTEQLLSRSTTW